jgi:hypothetical protein
MPNLYWGSGELGSLIRIKGYYLLYYPGDHSIRPSGRRSEINTMYFEYYSWIYGISGYFPVV